MKIEAIQKDLQMKSRLAVELAQNDVKDIVRRFIEEYYASYEPVQYERLYQLYSGIMETVVTPVGNGWVAHVYFDPSLFNYTSGTFTSQDVWDAASQGIHPVRVDKGGPIVGAPAWRDGEITAHSVRCLQQALIQAGIPVN